MFYAIDNKTQLLLLFDKFACSTGGWIDTYFKNAFFFQTCPNPTNSPVIHLKSKYQNILTSYYFQKVPNDIKSKCSVGGAYLFNSGSSFIFTQGSSKYIGNFLGGALQWNVWNILGERREIIENLLILTQWTYSLEVYI